MFGALLDKLVPRDENGSRGPADIIMGAAQGATMAQVGANPEVMGAVANAGLNNLSGMMSAGASTVFDPVGVATSAVSMSAAFAQSQGDESPALPSRRT